MVFYLKRDKQASFLYFTSSLFTIHSSLFTITYPLEDGLSWAPAPTETDSRGRLSLQIGRGITPHPSTALTPSPTGEGINTSPTFYLFTLHYSLFTITSPLHFTSSLFTIHYSLSPLPYILPLHSSLFTFHSSLFTIHYYLKKHC